MQPESRSINEKAENKPLFKHFLHQWTYLVWNTSTRGQDKVPIMRWVTFAGMSEVLKASTAISWSPSCGMSKKKQKRRRNKERERKSNVTTIKQRNERRECKDKKKTSQRAVCALESAAPLFLARTKEINSKEKQNNNMRRPENNHWPWCPTAQLARPWPNSAHTSRCWSVKIDEKIKWTLRKSGKERESVGIKFTSQFPHHQHQT